MRIYIYKERMETIKPRVSPELQNALSQLDKTYFIKSTNNLINHRVFYCNKWTEENNQAGLNILNLLKKECTHLKESFDKYTLIQLNIINAPPDCNTQLFHIDYQGDSLSYFVPLVELSDLNGTEYLYFSDPANYTTYFNILLKMSDEYLDKPYIIEYLTSKHGLKLGEDFSFKCANSDAYGLLYMPYYVYHRGQKNKTQIRRLMLNILFSIDNKFDYPVDEYILDSEIDEDARMADILELRNKMVFH
jgi:hypothetical protein